MLENTLLSSRRLLPVLALSHQDALQQALPRLVAQGRAEAVVLDDAGRYLGMVRLQDMLAESATTPAQAVSSVLRTDWPQFTASTSVWQAMRTLDRFVGETMPLLDEQDGCTVLGMVTEADLVAAYLEIVHDLRREENAAV
ncbi:MAG: CBS domain-containing protein [Thiolinea sp.]